jgi:phage replication-related protein YjqB (UPF0714/DUF867 family)
VKLESSHVRLSNAKAGAASVNGRNLRRGLPFVLAAVCASVLLVGASASGDYYHCYQVGHCTSPALSSANDCQEGRDYDVTVTNAGSGVTALSFHGGHIELHTSEISDELAGRYGWNRYDFDADGTAQCLTYPYDSNFKKLHITATNFDDPRAVALLAAHPKAVAIHGRGDSYGKEVICVGGKDSAAREAFIDYIEDNAAAWNEYTLRAVDATTASTGDCSDDELNGDDETNIVNRTSSSAGLQLELHPVFRDDLVNASSDHNALRDLFYGAVRQAMVVPAGCFTLDSAGATWRNRAFAPNQTGSFTAEMDATPQGSNIDAGVGLSNGVQTAYSGLACAVRFNDSGRIQARNGGAYAAASDIPYHPNTSYHFRFDVNVPAHTYSVYVTPEGDAEQVVGSDYAFRTEQATVSSLNNWSLFSEVGAMRGCGLASPSYTAGVGGPWINNSFAAQANIFTAEWDATPLEADTDAVVGLSNGAQTSFPGFACLVRFNSLNKIDARDGGAYRAASTIPYAPDTSYHFRLTVNVPAHTYSVYVTPVGGTEQVVGLNYAFRTEQSSVASLNNYGLIVDSSAGSARVSNFAVSSNNTLFLDGFTGADGLITNEYAHWNSDGILSPDWDMTSGSLFRQGNTAWSGAPDSFDPNKLSSDHTDSDYFRLTTLRAFAGNVKVSLAVKSNSDIHDSNCGPPNNDTCWHGVHIWLRHLTQYDLYYVSVIRADNKVVIKRKVPCGSDNDGFYRELGEITHPWSVGTWRHFSATIQTNNDGSVTIKVYDDDSNPNAPFLQATDGGNNNTEWSSDCATPGSYPTSQYPPLAAAGGVGVRGDFDNFNIDDFRVSSF